MTRPSSSGPQPRHWVSVGGLAAAGPQAQMAQRKLSFCDC